MEQFNTLKRRTTDLLQNAQSNMPAMPNMPQNLLRRQSQPDFVKGTWERIDLPPLPRSSHSLDIVAGAAYIFGGEINPREPVDNDMHVIRLPYSSAGADYYKIKATATVPDVSPQQEIQEEIQAEAEQAASSEASLREVPLEQPATAKDKGKGRATDEPPALDDVPEPRVGHATAVIGSRIFMFGGRGGPDMKPLEEAGRVWVFDTRSRSWSYLDPIPAVKGGAIVPHPAPRSYHCAAATEKPDSFGRSDPVRKPRNWREWAVGDLSKTGIPQDPVVGHVAETAVDEEDAGYGTFIVHAGCLASGDRTSDVWAFDVRSRMWTELPAAPGPSRGGTAICISKSRLFRYGGYDGEQEVGGQLDFLNFEVEMFDDNGTKSEVAIRSRGPWQSILQHNVDASSTDIPAEPRQDWPSARSVASLQAITVGGGRELLVLSFGEQSPSSEGHAGAGKFLDDVWTFQVPPQGMSAASLTAAVMQAVGRKTGEGRWNKVVTLPYDDDVDDSLPAGRGWLASAPMTNLEDSGILFWGGLSEDNKRLGDGWILRL
ncbi:hypothetical protein K4F52_008760 [Lecanicillium sp. MT-2017a]|nr:hypothetical protein K4F52_008760 [Lecanicillium sp. MT-2017a]